MDRNPRPVAVVLCAGASRRMGTPKALLDLDGRPLVAHHVDALRPHAVRLVVVLGAVVDPIRAVLPADVVCVVNEAWRTTWPADSLRVAILRQKVTGQAWVTPVDVPPADQATLQALAHAGADAVPVGPSGQPGHPVLIGPGTVDALRQRPPEGGLRTLLGGARRVGVAQEVGVDFDDPEAWRRFVTRWGRGSG
jgi:nicotine blue oxidoreductase